MKIETRRGKFLVIEGGPGSGKTTQARILSGMLGWTLYREPGGTEFGEEVREILQERHDLTIDKTASLFGYMTCRANLMALEIIPRLNKGENIILDRYWTSTYAYQGAEGVDKKAIMTLARIATQGVMPDLFIYYDIDPLVGQERKNRANQRQDRYDVKDLEFLRRVRENYRELAIIYSRRWLTIDASGTVEEVQQNTLNELQRRKLVK